jgi:hypothetical protein
MVSDVATYCPTMLVQLATLAARVIRVACPDQSSANKVTRQVFVSSKTSYI